MSAHQSRHDSDGHGEKAGGDRHGQYGPDPANGRVAPSSVDSERLAGAPEAVVDMQADGQHPHDVDEVYPPDLKVGDDIVIRTTVVEVRIGDAGRQIQQVPDDEQGEYDPSPAHRTSGEARLGPLAVGVAGRASGQVAF